MSVYEFETRIRYSEVDSKGYLTETALLDLFQNCSTFQSEDLGVGVDYLKSAHRAWVLSSWQIFIERRPFLGETVKLQTWSYGIKKALGFRNFRMLDSEGNTLGYADSLWVYVDTDTFEIVSCPDEESSRYCVSEKLEIPKGPRRIVLPKSMKIAEPFEVKSYFIDTNQHMNNGKYLVAAKDYIPDDFVIKTIRAEYKKQALWHDMINVQVSDMEEIEDSKYQISISMTDDDGNVYANLQFEGEKRDES